MPFVVPACATGVLGAVFEAESSRILEKLQSLKFEEEAGLATVVVHLYVDYFGCRQAVLSDPVSAEH